jgi:hypothetical protein
MPETIVLILPIVPMGKVASRRISGNGSFHDLMKKG